MLKLAFLAAFQQVDDGERSGAAALAGSALRDSGRAAAAAAAAADQLLLPGAAEQRRERLQPPSALLQPGRGHQDRRHRDLRRGRGRPDGARPLLQTGRRPGVRRPGPDHPGGFRNGCVGPVGQSMFEREELSSQHFYTDL